MSSYDVTAGRQAQAIDLSDNERALMEKLFANPSLWPDSAKVWIADYVSQNSLIPVSQLQGFTQFLTKYAEVVTQETTTSTSYTDLATAGPTVDGLSPGQYLIIFSCSMFPDAPGKGVQAAVSINGAAVDANDPALTYFIPGGATSFGGGVASIAMYKSLAASTNSLQMKYQMGSAGTGTFSHRTIIAIRVGNP